MEIKNSAIAGTLESSDVQVTVEPQEGFDISIQSSVINQYGNQIKASVLDALKKLEVTKGKVIVVDKGALDCTIKARIEAAVYRSNNASEKNIPWGDL